MAAQPRLGPMLLTGRESLGELIQKLRTYTGGIPRAIEHAKTELAAAAPRYTNVLGRVVSYTDTHAVITAVATIPTLPGEDPCHPAGAEGLRVSVVDAGGVTITDPAGYTLGTRRANASTWTVARPAAGEPDAEVVVESTLEDAFGAVRSDAFSDTDIILIRPQGVAVDLMSAVRVIARVVAAESDAFTTTVDVTLTGEGTEPPTAGTLAVDSWAGLDAADATPATVSGTLPLTQRYTISRPLWGGADGRAVWTGVATDIPSALSDKDAQVVPAIQSDTIPLTVRIERVSSSEAETVLDVIAADPRDEVVPAIALESYEGVSAPTAGASTVVGTTRTSRFTVARPALGAGQGRVTFRASAAGRVDDLDHETITEQGTNAARLTTRARVALAASSNTVHAFYAEVADPLGGAAPSVEVLEAVGVGTITGSGTSGDPWLVPRPAFGNPTGRVTVRATKTGRVHDDDAVEIPAQERDTVALTLRVVQVDKPTASTARYATYPGDPTDPGAPLEVGVEHEDGLGAAVTYDTVTAYFTVTRPPFGSNAGRVTFRAIRTDGVARTPARQSVDVPAVERDTVTLAPTLVRAGGDATTERYYATHGSVPAGVGAISYATSGTATVASGTGTLADPWIVARPAFNAGGARLTVTASATGAADGTDAVDIQPQEDVSTAGKVLVVGPMGLVPNNPTTPNVFNIATDGSYCYHSAASPSTMVMFGAFGLPPGAVVTQVRYRYRNPAGGTIQFYTYDGATNLDTAVITADSGGVDTTHVVALSHTVAADRPFFFWLGMQLGHAGAQRFVRAEVTYTAPSLAVAV